jgi:hypothetical protein
MLKIPPDLKQFLALTDAQADAVSKLFNDNQLLASEKSFRISQVQREIADELNKDPLDPMSIGVRYAEIEAIRRGLDAESERMRVAIRAVLTEPQKLKLKTLEEASKLSSTISSAVCYGFLDLDPAARRIAGGITGSSFVIYDPVNGMPYLGCGVPTMLTFNPGPLAEPTQK